MLSDITYFCKSFNIKQFVLIQNVMISLVRHSTSQNIHAIRNVERCNVRLCGISYSNTNQGDYSPLAHEKVPHKRVHTTRSLVGSLCFTCFAA